MTKTGNRFFLVLIILILVVGGYFMLQKPKPSTSVVDTNTPVTQYACGAHSIDAQYGATAVNLTLSDGRTFVLPQVVSASGVRYESNGVVFISKGDNAFLEENGLTTYADCVIHTDQNEGAQTNTFTDQGKTFTFTYPKEVIISGGGVGYTQEWRQNTQTLGLLLVKGRIEKSVQPQTNFSEATITVGTSSDATAVKNCLVATNGEQSSGKTTINGTSYSVFSLGDAGAGNFYDTTSYRTVLNKQCYAVEYTIHSTNIGAYSPDQGIKEFDKEAIKALLQGIVQSFRFLVVDQSAADSLLGKWTGVEGTSVTVLKSDTGYTLKFILLDGPISAQGTAVQNGIAFSRDNEAFILHKGTGTDTGMKYLTTKKNCVVVQQYEGYCKE